MSHTLPALKRASSIGLGLLPLRVLPYPDGGIDPPAEPYMLLGLYALDWPEPPPPPPSDDLIADILSGRYGTVRARNRALRLSSDLDLLEDVSPAILDGRVDLDNDRATLRAANLSLNPALFSSFNLNDDRLKLVREVYDPTEDRWIPFSLGVFVLDQPQVRQDDTGLVWDVEAADLSYILSTTHLWVSIVVPAGSLYTDVVTFLLDELGLQHEVPPSPLTTAVDHIWPWQTYYMTMVNDLLEGINYYPIWCDADGIFRSRERVDVFSESAAVRYRGNVEPRMIVPPWLESRQVKGTWWNGATLVQGDPARPPYFGLAVNVDPVNPLSTVTQILKVREFKGDFMSTFATMVEAAAYYVRDSAYGAHSATLMTFPDPRRREREVYEVSLPDGSGEDTFTRWRAVSWSLSLDESTSVMIHRMEEVTEIEIETAYGVTEP